MISNMIEHNLGEESFLPGWGSGVVGLTSIGFGDSIPFGGVSKLMGFGIPRVL